MEEDDNDEPLFEAQTKVRIKRSGEIGEVMGFAEHIRWAEPQYSVDYLGVDGSAKEAWFFESQIEAVQVS